MATPAELTARLDKLRRLRAKGVQTVRIDGEEVTYKTDAQMASAIADLERQIASVEGRQIRKVRITTSKGL